MEIPWKLQVMTSTKYRLKSIIQLLIFVVAFAERFLNDDVCSDEDLQDFSRIVTSVSEESRKKKSQILVIYFIT